MNLYNNITSIWSYTHNKLIYYTCSYSGYRNKYKAANIIILMGLQFRIHQRTVVMSLFANMYGHVNKRKALFTQVVNIITLILYIIIKFIWSKYINLCIARYNMPVNYTQHIPEDLCYAANVEICNLSGRRIWSVMWNAQWLHTCWARTGLFIINIHR